MKSAGWLTLVALALFVTGYVLSRNTRVPDVLSTLDARVRQAVVVSKSGDFRARLTAWQKSDGRWVKALGPFEAVVGRSGIAPEGEKREGDGRSPSGVFDLRRAFGYDPAMQTGLVYKQVGAEDKWVDDPQSPEYNTWIQGETQAKSFETLRRADDLYECAIVVEYNTEPVEPGKGSAIFVHIWRSPESPTAGCIALSEGNLRELLAWLKQQDSPVVALSAS